MQNWPLNLTKMKKSTLTFQSSLTNMLSDVARSYSHGQIIQIFMVICIRTLWHYDYGLQVTFNVPFHLCRLDHIRFRE